MKTSLQLMKLSNNATLLLVPLYDFYDFTNQFVQL